MSFSQALSGLNAAGASLDVLGNNISNSQTVGFKSSTAQFSDVFAGAKGLGTKVSAILQDFSNGNIETTNRELDIAISGEGFYRFQQNGEVVYSRNGQLSLTPDGYLQNAQGARIMGYGLIDANDAFSEVVVGGQPVPLNVPADDMPARATGGSDGANSGVRATYNLDASIDAGNADLKQEAELYPGFPKDEDADPVMVDYHYSNSFNVYDSLGNAQNVTTYFEKTTANNVWNVKTAINGVYVDNDFTITFDANGNILKDANGDVVGVGVYADVGQGNGSYVEDGNGGYVDVGEGNGDFAIQNEGDAAQLEFSPGDFNPEAETLSFAFRLAGTTQFANNSTANSLTQDGYTSGALVGITIEKDGTIMRNYTNEKSVAAGQVVLANFRNPEGLEQVGGNAWTSTADSGQELVGVPGTGLLGSIESNAIETSNVDLASELVDMIVTQRAYQANSQTIKTQDEVLQASINLR